MPELGALPSGRASYQTRHPFLCARDAFIETALQPFRGEGGGYGQPLMKAFWKQMKSKMSQWLGPGHVEMSQLQA